MASPKHNRQYDMIVFGATGYTGKLTAEHITTHFPTTLRWAIAGRSAPKLQAVLDRCRALNPDREPPSIEICSLSNLELSTLASKTFILITTVGPYAQHGEPAFRACAASGTQYLDVTGEVPWVASMIPLYLPLAQSTSALLLPQTGLESAPSDLLVYALSRALPPGTRLGPTTTTISISGRPSGGTLASALGLLESYPLSHLRASYAPFALSPVAHPRPGPPRPGVWTALTGLVRLPARLGGLGTTSIANRTDGAEVERTWGLFESVPALQDRRYGASFSFVQYMRVSTKLAGFAMHVGVLLLGLVMATPVLRRLVLRWVTPPGEGAGEEAAGRDVVEYRGLGEGEGGEGGKKVFGRVRYEGGNYKLTAILVAEAAATILEEDLDLPGGIYTPACLGQPYIDRLEKAGVVFETEMVDA
ncbi:saccharopine dehydrogenase [Schizothecium vesticola]|uniref:Saccharopine dehydrogenase n=1 Tax=Schizothecium vesticola TaxID=314040 RepID=A0AA40F8L1_9PEZI|nr:saccharopine dehydrogenase [Schizothecium vesticola]